MLFVILFCDSFTMRLLCQYFFACSLLITCFASYEETIENHNLQTDMKLLLPTDVDTLENRAHDPTDDLFNLVTDNPKPKRPLEPVKKWFENFIQNVANNARTQTTHSPISGSSSSQHYPTTTRSPTIISIPEMTSTTTSSSVSSTSTSATTTSTESSHSDHSDSHHRHHHHHHHSGKSKYRSRSRYHHHHDTHERLSEPLNEHSIHYIPVYPSPLPYQYPMMPAPIPATLPSPFLPAAPKGRDYTHHHHLMQAKILHKPSLPPVARQFYPQSNFIMIPGPTQTLSSSPPSSPSSAPSSPPQYSYPLPVPIMSYPYTRFDVERHRTNHYAQTFQPVPTKTRLTKYASESYPSTVQPYDQSTQTSDDYDTGDGEPVETRSAVMFLDAQPSLDSEIDEQNDDSPTTDIDDGQMFENGSNSQNHDDKAH